MRTVGLKVEPEKEKPQTSSDSKSDESVDKSEKDEKKK